jgi:hypothetical protein
MAEHNLEVFYIIYLFKILRAYIIHAYEFSVAMIAHANEEYKYVMFVA